jgi:hypothetical protein
MLTKIVDGLSSKLADQWFIMLLTPAFIFWAGGLLIWAWRFGWSPLEKWYLGLSPTIEVVMLLAAFLLVATSAVVVQRFHLPVLRLLEGYWPQWFAGIRSRLTARVAQRYQSKLDSLETLARKGLKNLSPEELRQYAELDRYITHMPTDQSLLMPTRIGNRLRAAELRSRDKYGLDGVICWPRLWLLLPEEAKKELTDARTSLNAAVNLFVWSLLFLVWTIWTWWAIGISLIVVIYAYYWATSLAEVYGELIESCYDLHRTTLYHALRWPLPKNPLEELQTGMQVTQYIWRGSDAATPLFVEHEQP